eukprot:1379610-Prymnesium_polylepis.1
MCSHTVPGSTVGMRAHLLRECKRAISRRPRQHQGTRCSMTHPGGRFVPAEKEATRSISN